MLFLDVKFPKYCNLNLQILQIILKYHVLHGTFFQESCLDIMTYLPPKNITKLTFIKVIFRYKIS